MKRLPFQRRKQRATIGRVGRGKPGHVGPVEAHVAAGNPCPVEGRHIGKSDEPLRGAAATSFKFFHNSWCAVAAPRSKHRLDPSVGKRLFQAGQPRAVAARQVARVGGTHVKASKFKRFNRRRGDDHLVAPTKPGDPGPKGAPVGGTARRDNGDPRSTVKRRRTGGRRRRHRSVKHGRHLTTIGDGAKRGLPGAKTTGLDAIDDFVSARMGEEFNARLDRVPTTFGEGSTDPFGLDREWVKYAIASVAVLHRHYFRTEVFGAENVPKGRVLLIANHSGQIPIDGALIGASMFMDVEPPRFCRAMVEKFTQTLLVGQVVGVPENARTLLRREEALLVFPEGVKGISKPFDRRYRLADFGLGFMRLAMETDTPIVPVAVVGGEEQYISVKNMDGLAKFLRVPSLPLLPQLLLPGGALPLPTKYRIWFGEPMTFQGDPDDDDAVIAEKVETVRATIQTMVNRGVRERKSIFF
ncbi:hypothetical protein OUZ56_032332 [Daphnia magna]|uniref:Phospholipid/glycerol acyltransferase domain-containing protein n=1 Tax=Daphnia magna TaxID=35525 RepID=A0ABR0B8M0_9CRUS|nr:hypothetical protein OUZ56_032332 [Daphnia magna]